MQNFFFYRIIMINVYNRNFLGDYIAHDINISEIKACVSDRLFGDKKYYEIYIYIIIDE